MSQHYFETTHKGLPISVLMGWDRPLQGYFMVIETSALDDLIYSNLDDDDLISCGGLPNSLDHFKSKLKSFEIIIPELMFTEIESDSKVDRGNRYVVYNGDGSIGLDRMPNN